MLSFSTVNCIFCENLLCVITFNIWNTCDTIHLSDEEWYTEGELFKQVFSSANITRSKQTIGKQFPIPKPKCVFRTFHQIGISCQK